jgi:hypothetical protein
MFQCSPLGEHGFVVTRTVRADVHSGYGDVGPTPPSVVLKVGDLLKPVECVTSWLHALTHDFVRVSVPWHSVKATRFGLLRCQTNEFAAGTVVVRLASTDDGGAVVATVWPAVSQSLTVREGDLLTWPAWECGSAPFLGNDPAPLVIMDPYSGPYSSALSSLYMPTLRLKTLPNRVQHGDWIVVEIPQYGNKFHIRPLSVIKLELIQTFRLPATFSRVIHRQEWSNLPATSMVAFQMPETAMPDRFGGKNSALFTCHTRLVYDIVIDGVEHVTRNVVSVVHSVGGRPKCTTDITVASPTSLRTLLRTLGTVSAHLVGGTITAYASVRIELRFENHKAVASVLRVKGAQVELLQTEMVSCVATGAARTQSCILTAHALPAFDVEYDTAGVAKHTILMEQFGACDQYFDTSTAATTVSGDHRDVWNLQVSHCLRLKLFNAVLSIPCTLAIWWSDHNSTLPPLTVSEPTSATGDNGIGQRRARRRRRRGATAAPDDNNNADDNDERNDDDDDGAGGAGKMRAEPDLQKLRRQRCRSCGFKVTDGKVRRAQRGCKRVQEHKEALDQLALLTARVDVAVMDAETKQVFKVTIVPQATCRALIWRLEEVTGRRVRSLTIRGELVAPDVHAADLALLDVPLLLEKEPADEPVMCSHCKTKNEDGLLFCKNEDDCGRLLPTRLNTRAYSRDIGLTECAICCEEFEDGAFITVLPCVHVFHAACAAKWLDRNPECPTCKTGITLENLSVA